MKRQKICIIGGGLTGLVTAIALSKLKCEIDLIVSKDKKICNTNRTTAISQNNYEFLSSLGISNLMKEIVWPCSEIKLYADNKKSNIFNMLDTSNSNKKNKVFYMLKNHKITKIMKEKIKKIKNISIKKNQKVFELQNSGLLKSIKFENNTVKYNLVVICTGSSSALVKNTFKDSVIENSYGEISVTTTLKHKSLKNNIARQIFLDNEIIAMLPIANNKTSIVWSKKKDLKENNEFFKNKIKSYTKNFLNNIKFDNNIESRELNFLVRKKYYKDRLLLFGDALHVIHPFIGQGFNMILRDLLCLQNILKKKIDLGLDVGSSDILSEFSNKAKPRNFLFSISSNILKNSFSIKNKNFKKMRNTFLENLNKNSVIKNIFFDIANKGFKF